MLLAYGIAADIYETLKTAGSNSFQGNPTLAAGDVKISIDGGAFTNMATLPSVVPTAGKQVKVPLGAAELTGKVMKIHFIDAAGAEWDDLEVKIETYGHASALHPNIGIAMRGTDSAALASVCTEGRLSELDAGNLPADIDTIKGDTTDIAAIKTQTDLMNFIGDDIKATLDGETVIVTPGSGVVLGGERFEDFAETTY